MVRFIDLGGDCTEKLENCPKQMSQRQWNSNSVVNFFSLLSFHPQSSSFLFLSRTNNVFRPAAKIIMDFTKGCKTVVSLMERREPTIADDAGSSGSEGYHSEPEADEAK